MLEDCRADLVKESAHKGSAQPPPVQLLCLRERQNQKQFLLNFKLRKENIVRGRCRTNMCVKSGRRLSSFPFGVTANHHLNFPKT